MQGHFKSSASARSVSCASSDSKVGRPRSLATTRSPESHVEIFAAGEVVDVVGVSKGKGFQGGVKRHNWKGGEASHGSMFHRAPGSIGASSDPSRVWPGHKLPGRMGGDRRTVLNLSVVRVLA